MASGYDPVALLTEPAPSFDLLTEPDEFSFVLESLNLDLLSDATHDNHVEARSFPGVSYHHSHHQFAPPWAVPDRAYEASPDENVVGDQSMPETPATELASDMVSIFDLDESPADIVPVVSNPAKGSLWQSLHGKGNVLLEF